MQIKTGKGSITVMVLFAIWSLSLAVDLPGLAVTPIEGSLRSIFTDATDFKIQLLTVLPNLLIIPFVLLSGKLSESRHKIAVITLGTVMFLVAGILSIFAHSLNMLIILSCFLGAGCGLILPFSTGLIADVFTGKYRMKQMGIVSAIGNIALVAATFAVGFLVAGDLTKTWHRAFFVYLIPLISLVLIPFLHKIPDAGDSSDNKEASATEAKSDSTGNNKVTVTSDGFSTAGQTVKGGFYVGRTVGVLLAYFCFIFVTCVPTYYLPNVKWVSAEDASTMTSVFYLSMFAVGITLTAVMRVFKKATFVVAAALVVGGLALYNFIHGNVAVYIVAAALCGIGLGIVQPTFYTKATSVVTNPGKSTLALAYVQVANYVAISIVPVIIDSAEKIFHTSSTMFPFAFAGVCAVILLIIAALRSRHFTFGISSSYY